MGGSEISQTGKWAEGEVRQGGEGRAGVRPCELGSRWGAEESSLSEGRASPMEVTLGEGQGRGLLGPTEAGRGSLGKAGA